MIQVTLQTASGSLQEAPPVRGRSRLQIVSRYPAREYEMGMKTTIEIAAAITSMLSSAACSSPPDDRYELKVLVTSDPERPLAGALLLHEQTPLGRTDESGSVTISVRGT